MAVEWPFREAAPPPGHVALPDCSPHRPSFFYTPLPSIADRLQNHRALSPRPATPPASGGVTYRDYGLDLRNPDAPRPSADQLRAAKARMQRDVASLEHRLATLERRLLHTAQCAVLGYALASLGRSFDAFTLTYVSIMAMFTLPKTWSSLSIC